jgi:WD40 repeat protein
VATLEGHSNNVQSVAFHPTAPLLATGSFDNTVRLWLLSCDNSSATCVATLEGHSYSVYSVAFHPTAPGTSDVTSSWWSLSTDPMLDGPANSIQASPKAELAMVSLVR